MPKGYRLKYPMCRHKFGLYYDTGFPWRTLSDPDVLDG